MTKTLNDIYMDIRKRFKDADVSSPYLEARELCAFVCGVDKNSMANWGFLYISDSTCEKCVAYAERRLNGEPLAYLLGEWDFYGLTFNVTPDVLIPRSDTESLCEAAVKCAQNVVNPRVLDLCCGSGCIGVSIAKYVEDARVTAIDISENALRVTRENAARHKVTPRFAAILRSALEPPEENLGKFHIIVSNPPYISSREIPTLDISVKAYEPMLALDGGEDGLIFYRSISEKWKDALLPDGKLFFECGMGQFTEVAAILEDCGYKNIEILEDLSGVKRIVVGTAPEITEQMLQF